MGLDVQTRLLTDDTPPGGMFKAFDGVEYKKVVVEVRGTMVALTINGTWS
jgi:hypothetical protein